jgi:prepilin-type N-terminal cleavage/methylation domain-containing protein
VDTLHKKGFGFTLVEILVVIAVLGVLVTLTLVVAGNWRLSTAQTEVKSDLKSVVGAMENARNFGTGYPTSIPSTFTASENVTITYASGSAASYCINGSSTAVSSVQYYVNSALSNGKEPQAGTC